MIMNTRIILIVLDELTCNLFWLFVAISSNDLKHLHHLNTTHLISSTLSSQIKTKKLRQFTSPFLKPVIIRKLHNDGNNRDSHNSIQNIKIIHQHFLLRTQLRFLQLVNGQIGVNPTVRRAANPIEVPDSPVIVLQPRLESYCVAIAGPRIPGQIQLVQQSTSDLLQDMDLNFGQSVIRQM